jgi:CRP-like cAMP-binding protein
LTIFNQQHQQSHSTALSSPLNYRHIFTPPPSHFWETLIKQATTINLNRRSHFYHIGDQANEVYLVSEGLLLLSSLFEDGRELGQVILSHGCIFGEQEIINNTPRIHQAMALTDCKIYIVKELDFNYLINSSPEFSLYLAQIMSARLQRSELRLGYFASHNVAQRLAQLLLELADAAGGRDKSSLYLSPCPTHGELSNILVSTRETISLIMGEFRRKKMISFDRRQINFLNKSALAQYLTTQYR